MTEAAHTAADSASPVRSWQARVLALDTVSDIAAELQRLGVSPADLRGIEDHMRLRLVKLEGLPPAAAHGLERRMLTCGGRAVVAAGHGAGPRKGGAACLLVGTISAYHCLLAKLSNNRAGLAQAGVEIKRALNAFDNPAGGELRCGERVLRLGERTLLMGIINATLDSFSGDGLAGDIGAMVARGEEMAAQGADIIDIGGESTRPGSDPVDAQMEIARVRPVIQKLAQWISAPISIDTYKAEVARAALDAGATIINDVTALRGDAGMAALAAARRAPVVVMHMQGTPKTMQQAPHYDDLTGEICAYLRESVDLAEQAGVARDQVVIDPGFGFGKTANQNLEIVRRLRELKSLGQPVLLGPSRKSTIGKVLAPSASSGQVLPPAERLEGTLAVLALAAANGADVLRVHDVAAARRAVRMAEAVMRGWPEE